MTVEREAEIAASGLTPLEYFLKILRDPDRQDKERFAAAVAAAPYCHPKLASTEHSGKVDAGGVTIVRLTDLVDSAAAPVDPQAVPAPARRRNDALSAASVVVTAGFEIGFPSSAGGISDRSSLAEWEHLPTPIVR